MSGYEIAKIMFLSYMSIQLWMLIALLTEEISSRNDLSFGAKEAYTLGPLGLLVCLMLYVEKKHKQWVIEQGKKWDR